MTGRVEHEKKVLCFTHRKLDPVALDGIKTIREL